MRLRKSFDGIPQAPGNCHGEIDYFVIAIGFQPLKPNPYIHTYTHQKWDIQLCNQKQANVCKLEQRHSHSHQLRRGSAAGEPEQSGAQVAGEEAREALRQQACGGLLYSARNASHPRSRGRDTRHYATALHQVGIPDVRHRGGATRCTRSESDRSYQSIRGKRIS